MIVPVARYFSYDSSECLILKPNYIPESCSQMCDEDPNSMKVHSCNLSYHINSYFAKNCFWLRIIESIDSKSQVAAPRRVFRCRNQVYDASSNLTHHSFSWESLLKADVTVHRKSLSRTNSS